MNTSTKLSVDLLPEDAATVKVVVSSNVISLSTGDIVVTVFSDGSFDVKAVDLSRRLVVMGFEP